MNLSKFKFDLKRTLGMSAIALLFGGGMFAGAAGVPAFNNTADDYNTVMVAKSGQPYAASASATPGEVLSVLIWDHNSVPDSVATNVKIKATIPTNLATSHQVTGTVSADNASTVTGTAAINVGSETRLSYVPGSAQLLKNVVGEDKISRMSAVNWPTNITPDNVVTTGINLGSQAGCWQYAQAVVIQVKVEGVAPAINTNKRVERAGGDSVFGVAAIAQPGDYVNFKIFLQNTGTGTGVAPRIVDTLDSRLTYVPNSSYMLIKQNNTDYRVDLLDTKIKFEGQKITWAFQDMAPRPDAALYLIFQARVADKTQFPIGTTVINNIASAGFANATANTNNVTITINRSAEPVVNFSLRKEVTNLSLGDSKWYDEQLASAGAGDTIAYRLMMQNTGNTTAANVTLKDILPAGVTFDGHVVLYNKDNINGKVISTDEIVKTGYLFPTVEAGSANMQTIIFQAKLTNDCSGQQTLINKSQVLYNGAVAAQDTATVVFSCVRGLIITKDIQDPTDQLFKDSISVVRESQVLTYRINVQNNGNTVVNNPILRDVLPNQVTYVNNSLSIDGEFMTSDIQQAFLNQGMVLTNLTPGMGKVIKFQVRVNDCPPLGDIPLVNTAYVKADGIAEISDKASTVVRVFKPVLR